MNNFRITQNFSFHEMTLSNRYPEFNRENMKRALEPANLSRGYSLCTLAEEARDILGVPLIVGAGFRYSELNKAVGGAPHSQHLMFEAIDFTPKHEYYNDYESMSIDLNKILMRFAERELMFGQLICETQFDNEKQEPIFWFHLSLGHPFRELSKCRQVLEYDNGSYKEIAKLSVTAWQI